MQSNSTSLSTDRSIIDTQKEETPTRGYDRKSSRRLAAIDVLRAFTMVLMIFVNDLWSLKNIPTWLEHVPPGVDGLGLADVVFPAFLFIVGLSLPFSIDARRLKGDSNFSLTSHVLLRSLALLIMGVFLVNGETLNESATGLSKSIWYPLCCLCFILIWNNYPGSVSSKVVVTLRVIAIATLVLLAIVYRGGDDDNIERFAPQWWGILGLIGWAYLVSALITVFSRNNIIIILAAWIIFSTLSILKHAELLPEFISIIPSAISGGTLTALTIGGVLTTLIFQHYRKKNNDRALFIVLSSCAVFLVLLSFLTRPFWGISKLSETPAWLFLCSAITLGAFLLTYWLTDVKQQNHWFRIVKPAGTATLLCYLIPYFAYAATALLGISLPEVVLIGGTGLLKSFLFALLCTGITGLLLKWGLRFRL